MVDALLNCRLEEYEDLLLAETSRSNIFGRFFEGAPDATHEGFLEKYTRKCLEADLRLVKSIRLHLDELLKLTEENQKAAENYLEHISVVVLMRDPRAVVNSMLNAPVYRIKGPDWDSKEVSHATICQHILRDFDAVDRLRLAGVPVLLVRYEDLVDDPPWQVGQILRFLDREDLYQPIMEAIRQHLADDSKEQRGYYDTKRPSWFAHDEWKDSLPSSKLRELQEEPNCIEAMRIMDYEIMTT